MTNNLPAPIEPSEVSLGGQASLWADPDGLLILPVERLRLLAVEVAHDARPLLAQIRRVAGLVAWAGWHRLNEKDYRTFAAGLASDLGIDVPTLARWRRTVTEREDLAVPSGLPTVRKAAGRKRITAGQPEGSDFHPAREVSNETAAIASPEPPERPEPIQERLAPPEPANGAPAPPDRLPSLRQYAAAVIDALQDAEEGCGAKWTPEEATYFEGRAAREMANWRRAHGLGDKPVPRSPGRVIKPEDRPPPRAAPPASIPAQSGAPARSLARRQVEPMFKAGAK